MKVRRLFGFSVCLLIGIFLFCNVGVAEEDTPMDTEEKGIFNLGEIVVTGEGETITQVTTVETLDRGYLDLTDSTDVSKALETLPGVAVSFGSRNEGNLNVRGFNQRYVPIFYDGIPWYIPNDGYVDASEISTGNISKITLTKGSASVLYGPNTMGGVINIISMKPQKTFEGSYSAEANKNGYIGSLNLGSRLDRFYIMGGISGMNNNDYRMSNDFSPIPEPVDWYEDGGKRDNSDIERLSGSLKLGFVPAEGYEFAVGFHKTESEKGLPPNVYTSERQRFWRFSDWEKKTYYFIGNSKIADLLSVKLRIYRDEYYNVLDSYDDENYDSQTMGYAFHGTYDDYTNGGSIVLRSDIIERNILSLSFHYKEDVHEEKDDYGDPWEKYEAKTFSYGLEDDLKLTENLGLVIGANYDIQKAEYADGGALREDDGAWNVLGGLHYTFEDATKAHLSIARKTRFPTLNELYSSYLGTSTPNPNLKKERSTNYEAGVEKPLPWESSGSFAVFYSDVEDLITRTRVAGNDFYDNVGKSRFRGFEVSFKTAGIPLNTLEAHYTYLDTENRSKDRTTSHLSESPKYQFYISDLVTVTDMISIFAKAQYNKGQWEEKRDNSWTELDDYWLVDIKTIVALSKLFALELGIRNLFDENYETSYGIPREGRAAFCGVRGNF